MAQEKIKLLEDKLYTCKGMVRPTHCNDVTEEYLEEFEIRDHDRFIDTSNKSGTVWTQRIMPLLKKKDIPADADKSLQDRVPLLEFRKKGDDFATPPSPQHFCSNLKEPLIPRRLQKRGKDLRGTIVRISEFVGKHLSDAAIKTVVEKVSFTSMKKDPKTNYESLPVEITDPTNGTFPRKGTKGTIEDWKNYLSVAQNNFDQVYQEQNFPLKLVWDLVEL